MEEKTVGEKIDSLLDAVKELTKVVGENVKEMANLRAEWEKWRKAGKF